MIEEPDMDCLTELDYGRYCDGDFGVAEKRHVDAHLASCPDCRKLMASLEAENEIIRGALDEVPPEPAAVQVVAGGLAIALVVAVAIRWITSGFAEWSLLATAPSAVGVLVSLVQRVGYPAAIILSVVIISVALLIFVKKRPALPFVAAFVLVLGAPLEALTIRTGGEIVRVAAGTIIHDDVIASGQVVRIEGTIDGDLYALASRIEITGTVTGRVFALAESVIVGGRAEAASLSAFARTVSVEGQVRAWRAWAERISMIGGARTTGDLQAMGRFITLGGHVDGRTVVYGHALTVESTARLGGLRAYVGDPRGLDIAGAAVLTGLRELRAGPRSKLSREALIGRLVLTLLTSAAGAWLWRRRRRFLELSALRLTAWWSSLGRGVARVGVAMTVLAGLAVTIIGVPLALAGLVLLAVASLVGQIVVAAFLAEHLRWRGGQPAFELRLLAALVIISLLSLPGWGIGGTLSGLLSLAGIGAVVIRPGRGRPA